MDAQETPAPFLDGFVPRNIRCHTDDRHLQDNSPPQHLTSLDGFVPRQIRPRLPAPGRRVAAPTQSGAAGLAASRQRRTPCLRAHALRQSDRTNAPQERSRPILSQGHAAPSAACTSVLLADLSRDKSVRACLPLAGALPRPPSQARTDGQRNANGEPLASALARSGNRIAETLHRSVSGRSSGTISEQCRLRSQLRRTRRATP
jgi:hypothetical protein